MRSVRTLFFVGCVGSAFLGAIAYEVRCFASVDVVSLQQEWKIIGGAWFTSSECISDPATPPGGCTSVPPSANVTCAAAGVAPGGICGGTGWCSDDWVDDVCSAPYPTNNPFDVTCSTDPATSCDRTLRVCSAASGTCSDYAVAGNPALCGSHLECSW
jgi:hypothetical protein